MMVQPQVSGPVFNIPVLRTGISQSQGEEIRLTDQQEIHELLYTVSQSCNPYISVPCSIQLQSTCTYRPSLTLSYIVDAVLNLSSWVGRNTGTGSSNGLFKTDPDSNDQKYVYSVK